LGTAAWLPRRVDGILTITDLKEANAKFHPREQA
jgi:hypothetical protein